MHPSTSTPITILLAEDHTIVRQGLRALLETHDDLQVVGEAADGHEAVAEARRLHPAVVVMDLGLPGVNGVEATRAIVRELPQTRVLVLSMHSGSEYVLPAVQAGAGGYLVKGSGLADLVAAIRALAADQGYFSPEAAKVLAVGARHAAEAEGAGDGLTAREREVLRLVVEGRSGPQIAQLLGISPKTVEGHRGHIMAKLGIHDVPGLVRYAIRTGLVST